MAEGSRGLRSCALAQRGVLFLVCGSLLRTVNLHFWETERFLAALPGL